MNTKHLFLLAALALPPLSASMQAQTYTIYPVPQEQTALGGTTSFTSIVNIVLEEALDTVTRNRVIGVLEGAGLGCQISVAQAEGMANILVGVNGSGGVADRAATTLGLDRTNFSIDGVFDRHILSLTDDGGGNALVVILGESADAAFYGFASLEQIFNNGTTGLPTVNIYDYADLQYRGIVEGYYGYPYTAAVKKDLMRFMMRYKMNTYMYGAKSDPYHSDYWASAYPTSITAEEEAGGWLTQDMLRELTQVSHDTKVNFIWAIHPGDNFIYSSTVVNDIFGKFKLMYDLGVRQFGIFVDDVSIPSSEDYYAVNAANLQAVQDSIDNRWNYEGAAAADTVKPLQFVPHIYAVSFASSSSAEGYFNALASTDEKITIYMTGYGVWTVPNSSDLLTFKNYLGRDLAWWWNYPCNDNADGQIYPKSMYSNFSDMPAVTSSSTLPASLSNGRGIVSNPMQEGEVSKIALFSVADYAWNNSGFSNTNSWNAAFSAVIKDKSMAEAFQNLSYYLTKYDPSSLSSLASYATDPSTALTLLQNIYKSCVTLEGLAISDKESDRLLWNDMSPWYNKLRTMAEIGISLVNVATMDNDNEDKWATYAQQLAPYAVLNTDSAYMAYALEGMGADIEDIPVSTNPAQCSATYLEPFVDDIIEEALGNDFFGEKTTSPVVASNASSYRARVVSSNNSVYLLTTQVITLADGEYIGISLPEAVKPTGLTIADTLLSNYSVVCSADGKNWTRLTSSEVPDTYIRHLLVLNESGESRALRLSSSSALRLTLPFDAEVASATAPTTSYYDSNGPENLYDGDYTTCCIINQNQTSGDAYTLTLEKPTHIYNVRVAIDVTNSDYMTAGRVRISSDGSKWTILPVRGYNTTKNFTANSSGVKWYNDNVFYCDFEGYGTEAQYVQLYIQTANTSKWVRVGEIEVNKSYANEDYSPVAQDGLGARISTLNDGHGYTGLDNVEGRFVLYNFQQLALLSSVTIYQDASFATDGTTEVLVSTDGETFTSLGTLYGYQQTFDLSSYAEALYLKIAWTGSTPPIYEIVETRSDNAMPEVTDIVTIALGRGSDLLSVAYTKGTLSFSSAVGLRSVEVVGIDGRLLMKASLCGETASLPFAPPVGAPVMLIRTTMNIGQTVVSQLYAK